MPNIHNAWTYICESECQKAIEAAVHQFENSISEIKLPCNDSCLDAQLSKARKESLSLFRSKVIGGSVAESKLKLKEQIANLHASCTKRNQEISTNQMVDFLRQAFHPIQVSLRTGQFHSLEELQEGIAEFV